MRAFIALIALLSPMAGLAQRQVEPPNAKTAVYFKSADFYREAFQFGPPKPVQLWQLSSNTTVGVYEDGPLISRNWRLMLAVDYGDETEIEFTAFRLPSPWRGPSGCICREVIEIVSWETLGESLAKLVLLSTYENQRSILEHDACGEMCTQFIKTEYLFIVDLTSPIHCLACEIPVRVLSQIYANDYEAGRLVFQVETETVLNVHFADGVLTVTAETEDLAPKQEPWPGTYVLGRNPE